MRCGFGEPQNIADGSMRFNRVPERRARIDEINIAPAASAFRKHACRLEIRDDVGDGSLGNTDLIRQVAYT